MMVVVGVARADDRPFKVQLVNDLDAPVFSLEGDIYWGARFAFDAAIDKRGNGWLILNSQGGSTDDAMAIGRAVRRLNIKTIVPDGVECLSSCAIIWAAGAERWSARKSVIAFHRPWHKKTLKDADQTLIRAYFREMGYTPEAIEKFMWPAKSFFYLDAKKARKLKMDVHFTE